VSGAAHDWRNDIEAASRRIEARAPHFLRETPLWKLSAEALGAVSVRKMDGIQETLKFPLPKGLKLDDIPPPRHIS